MDRAASSTPPAAAILVAAGRGRRMGGVDKAFIPLGGRTLLERALQPLAPVPDIDRIIAVVPPARLAEARRLLASVEKVAAVVAGGDDRQASVASGLAAADGAAWVVVHDAARPLATPGLTQRVLEAARAGEAATAALPARDTVKAVAEGVVAETLSRERLWLTQTPQAFRGPLLQEAHRRAEAEGRRATDDAALVEAAGGTVRTVEGEPFNLKVTTWEDLAVAEAVLRAREGPEVPCMGVGYDIHRLVPGRRLVLGGVEIPSPRGLAGHSDADALLHAVMDALLGAAGLPDIGHRFPPGDPAFKDADSGTLLREVRAAVEAAGCRPIHVDAVIVAEEPMLAPYLPRMRAVLAEALNLPAGGIGLKATTAEGLGAIGRGEGIAVHAVATAARRG